MKAPYNAKPRVLPPQGTFIGRVVNITYIGTILEKNSFQGGIEVEVPKLRITWELPTEKTVFKEGDEAKPFVVSKEFTHSMGKKSNLRPITEHILGIQLSDEEAYSFDHDNLLGLTCQVTITHEEKESGTYEKITSVGQLLKGVTCPPAYNELTILSFEKWNEELFNKLPEFIRKKIVSSKEYKKMKNIETQINPEEIPF